MFEAHPIFKVSMVVTQRVNSKDPTSCNINVQFNFFNMRLLLVVATVLTCCQSESGVSPRDPKFFEVIRKFLKPITQTQPQPVFGNGIGLKEKFSQEQPLDYNQYFVNNDPYNQNQLLSAVTVSTVVPGHLDAAASEHDINGGGGESSESGINSINTFFTKLIGDDTSSTSSIISNILSLGTGSMEQVLQRVNTFDSLKCIPRMLCQTVAHRQLLDGTKAEVISTTTLKPRVNDQNPENFRDVRTIKFVGVDTALAQFMGFLDLVNLKNWSLYPYLKGAYEGAQVKRVDECAQRFETCPFSDKQLVYYFNNYNGGFFQSLRGS